MMENSRYNSFEDKQFKELLDECYFHPSRKYASDEIKFMLATRCNCFGIWMG